MALLAVDIGNTSTTIGLFAEDGRIETRFDIPTRTLTHRDSTRELLDAPLAGVAEPTIIGIASVVPWASDELTAVLRERFPEAKCYVLTSANIPMEIDYPQPEELGTDRLLGALGAFKQWGEAAKRPCIVVDLGTATTFDCVTEEGVFLGGAIAPGLDLGAEALANRAAQLPSIELSFPSSVIGRTTVESMQSGVLYGGLGMIEGLVQRLREFRFPNANPIVGATGGLSGLFEGRTNVVDHFDPTLVLNGIRIASEIIARNEAILNAEVLL